MKMIQVRERCLYFDGDTDTALRLVESLRDAYDGTDMPKMLNDFVFNIEVELQDVGVLDQDFDLDKAHRGESECWTLDVKEGEQA